MRKIFGLIAALILSGGILAATTPSPVQASTSAYTYVQYVNQGATGRTFQVRCHANSTWHTLSVGMTSRGVCGDNGWVEAGNTASDLILHVQNISTGNVTNYPTGCSCSIGGGYYYAWVTVDKFCGGCGGGRVSTPALVGGGGGGGGGGLSH